MRARRLKKSAMNGGLAFVFALLGATHTYARDAAEGLWRTEPDKNGLMAIVKAQPCGETLCGTIQQIIDSRGKAVSHRNVGVRLFWDMRAKTTGQYRGRAYVPTHGRNYAATMTVTGNKMRVKGCLGPVCQSQRWQRMK